MHKFAAKHILVRICSAKEPSRQASLFHNVWPMLSFECAFGHGSSFRKSTSTLDVLAAIAVRFRVYITRSNNTGSVDTQTNRRAGGAARTRGRQGGAIVSMIDRLVWLTCDPLGNFRARRGDRDGAMRMTSVSQVLTTEEKYGEHAPTLRRPGNLSRRLTSRGK